ncbi:acetyltransferase [Clostridia bacterium]|nr:acetyltransferase [Clostridia bacterium]
MEIIIREAVTKEDYGKIARLAEVIWDEHYSSIISKAQIDYMVEKFQSTAAIEISIENEAYTYLLAEADGAAVAYAGATLSSRNDTPMIFLSKIYVARDYRGMGIAKRGFKMLCEKFGTDLAYLTVNKNNIISIAAYRKLGFEITESVVADIGGGFVMDDYIMERFPNPRTRGLS